MRRGREHFGFCELYEAKDLVIRDRISSPQKLDTSHFFRKVISESPPHESTLPTMETSKNFLFGLILAIIATALNEYLRLFEFEWYLFFGFAFLACLPWKIGKNVYSVFGGWSDEGSITSLCSIYQEAKRTSFSFFGIAYQKAGWNAWQIVGISYQDAGGSSGQAIGVAFQLGYDADQLIGVAFQNPWNDSVQGFGIAFQSSKNDTLQVFGIAYQYAGRYTNQCLGISWQKTDMSDGPGAGPRVYILNFDAFDEEESRAGW